MTLSLNILLLLFVLIIAVMTDIRGNRIPNWLTLPAMITGIILNMVSAGVSGFLFGLEGLLLGMALFIGFYIMGGMGAGDVKLMGAVGAMLGPRTVFISALYTALAGGIYALTVIALNPRARAAKNALVEMVRGLIYLQTPKYNRSQTCENSPKLCYAVAIAIGTIAGVVLKT